MHRPHMLTPLSIGFSHIMNLESQEKNVLSRSMQPSTTGISRSFRVKATVLSYPLPTPRTRMMMGLHLMCWPQLPCRPATMLRFRLVIKVWSQDWPSIWSDSLQIGPRPTTSTLTHIVGATTEFMCTMAEGVRRLHRVISQRTTQVLWVRWIRVMSLLLQQHVPYALCLPIGLSGTQLGQRSITLLDFLSTKKVIRAEAALAASRPRLLLPVHISAPGPRFRPIQSSPARRSHLH
jgi:hypothetical protein